MPVARNQTTWVTIVLRDECTPSEIPEDLRSTLAQLAEETLSIKQALSELMDRYGDEDKNSPADEKILNRITGHGWRDLCGSYTPHLKRYDEAVKWVDRYGAYLNRLGECFWYLDWSDRFEHLPLHVFGVSGGRAYSSSRDSASEAAEVERRRTSRQWLQRREPSHSERFHQRGVQHCRGRQPEGRILEKKNIDIDTWLRDHPPIKRTTFSDWKAATSGKPVKRKVSVKMSREFEKAILQDAVELGLEIPEDLLGPEVPRTLDGLRDYFRQLAENRHCTR